MKSISYILVSALTIFNVMHAQTDSVRANAKQAAESARLKMGAGDIRMAIQNVDITRFPEIKLIVEAVNADGTALDSINPKEFSVVENGVTKRFFPLRKYR